jgi:hypothetical protein
MNVPDERGLKPEYSGTFQAPESLARWRDERPRREGIETFVQGVHDVPVRWEAR